MPQSAFNAQRVYGDVTHRNVVETTDCEPAVLHAAHERVVAALQVADAEKMKTYDEALRGGHNEKAVTLGIDAGADASTNSSTASSTPSRSSRRTRTPNPSRGQHSTREILKKQVRFQIHETRLPSAASIERASSRRVVLKTEYKRDDSPSSLANGVPRVKRARHPDVPFSRFRWRREPTGTRRVQLATLVSSRPIRALRSFRGLFLRGDFVHGRQLL